MMQGLGILAPERAGDFKGKSKSHDRTDQLWTWGRVQLAEQGWACTQRPGNGQFILAEKWVIDSSVQSKGHHSKKTHFTLRVTIHILTGMCLYN